MIKKIWLLIIILLISGCYSTNNIQTKGTVIKIKNDENSAYYVVVGFAIIKITNTKNNDVAILDSTTLGCYFDNQSYVKGGVGFNNSNFTIINPNSNTLIKIQKNPIFGNANIKIQKIKWEYNYEKYIIIVNSNYISWL